MWHKLIGRTEIPTYRLRPTGKFFLVSAPRAPVPPEPERRALDVPVFPDVQPRVAKEASGDLSSLYTPETFKHVSRIAKSKHMDKGISVIPGLILGSKMHRTLAKQLFLKLSKLQEAPPRRVLSWSTPKGDHVVAVPDLSRGVRTYDPHRLLVTGLAMYPHGVGPTTNRPNWVSTGLSPRWRRISRWVHQWQYPGYRFAMDSAFGPRKDSSTGSPFYSTAADVKISLLYAMYHERDLVTRFAKAMLEWDRSADQAPPRAMRDAFADMIKANLGTHGDQGSRLQNEARNPYPKARLVYSISRMAWGYPAKYELIDGLVYGHSRYRQIYTVAADLNESCQALQSAYRRVSLESHRTAFVDLPIGVHEQALNTDGCFVSGDAEACDQHWTPWALQMWHSLQCRMIPASMMWRSAFLTHAPLLVRADAKWDYGAYTQGRLDSPDHATVCVGNDSGHWDNGDRNKWVCQTDHHDAFAEAGIFPASCYASFEAFSELCDQLHDITHYVEGRRLPGGLRGYMGIRGDGFIIIGEPDFVRKVVAALRNKERPQRQMSFGFDSNYSVDGLIAVYDGGKYALQPDADRGQDKLGAPEYDFFDRAAPATGTQAKLKRLAMAGGGPELVEGYLDWFKPVTGSHGSVWLTQHAATEHVDTDMTDIEMEVREDPTKILWKYVPEWVRAKLANKILLLADPAMRKDVRTKYLTQMPEVDPIPEPEENS